MTDVEPASVARGFLFADLRNYSAWVESHGDHAAATLLRAYRGIVRQAVAEFNGAEIKTEGDSFYVVFGSPSAAVKCGLRIVELAAESQAAAGRPIPVGVGVHAGETVMTDEGYVGSVVNVAARVCAQAAAGELLVTDAVRSLTRTYLNATFVPRGRRRLKGISEPIALYRVTPGRVPAAVPLWRRLLTERPSVAAMLAIGVLVAAALIGGALVRESGATDTGPSGAPTDPGPSGVPTITPTMTAVASAPGPTASAEIEFPSASEADLIALAPAGYREACARADPAERPIIQVVPPGEEPPPGEPRIVRAVVTAGIVCDMGGLAAPDLVWYWDVIPDRPAEGDNAQAAIARHAGIVGAPPGTCRDGVPALERWSFGGASGQLVCYETDEGDAVVLWVFDDAELFGKAVRDDRDVAALLEWWEDVGRFSAP